jgi:hypothetical protein
LNGNDASSFNSVRIFLHRDDVENKVAIAEGGKRRLESTNLLWESKEANDDLA